MNRPEILRLIRHELQRAVAERGAPPTPQPMDASPWVAMSAMQKAIRRGAQTSALQALRRPLLRNAPGQTLQRAGRLYRL